MAASLKHLIDLRSDSRTLGESVSSALQTSQVATTGPEALNRSNLFVEQKALKQPQALPYLSEVVGARAIAAREEAVLRSRLILRFCEFPTEEFVMESDMISLKKFLCGLSFLEPEFCGGDARLD